MTPERFIRLFTRGCTYVWQQVLIVSAQTMFPEFALFSGTFESRAKIRILVLPVGNISKEQFDAYFHKLNRFACIPLQTLTPPPSQGMQEGQNCESSMFQYQSWQYGAVCFEFINGNTEAGAKLDRTLVNDLNLHRSTLVVFGVCNCPSSSDEDLKTLFFDFLSGSKVSLPPAVILKHCFAFDVTDVQLQTLSSISSSQSQNFSIFVSDRESDEAGSILDFQLQQALGNVCVRIIQELDHIVRNALNNQSPPTLSNGMDASLAQEDAVMRNKQQKKWELRYNARLRKWAGDFCLLAAAPTDALQHYTMALSMMKQNGKPTDHLWYAAAYEGHAAATIMATMEALDTYADVAAVAAGAIDILEQSKLPFQEDVQKYAIESARHYRIHGAAELEVSVLLKLCHYFSKMQIPRPVDAMKIINEDAHKSLHKLNTSGKICFLVEICLLSEKLGLRRKYAYYCHKLSILYATLMNWPTAYSFSQLSGRAYGLSVCHTARLPNHERDSGVFINVGGSEPATWTSIKRQHLLELFQFAKLTSNHDLATLYAVEELRTLQAWEGVAADKWQVKTEGTLQKIKNISSAEDSKKKLSKTKFDIDDLRHLSPAFFRGHKKEQLEPSSSPMRGPYSAKYSRSITSSTKVDSWALPKDLQDAQQMIAQKLSLVTGGLMPNVFVDMNGLPKLLSLEILPLPSARRHKRYSNGGAAAHTMGEHGSKIYYDPFSRKPERSRQAIEWVEGEIGEVMVTLENKLLFPISVQHMCIRASDGGPPIEAFGQSVVIPAKTIQSVVVSLKLLGSGMLSLSGVTIVSFNLRWHHQLSAPNTGGKAADGSVYTLSALQVNVLPKLPLLMIRDIRAQSGQMSRMSGSNVTHLSLLDGQLHNHNLLLQNIGHVPVGYIKLQLTVGRRRHHRESDMRGIAFARSRVLSKPKFSLSRAKSVTVFSSLAADADGKDSPSLGNPKPERVDDDFASNDVFSWNKSTFELLKEKLPLAPGNTIILPITIDAQRDIPTAELKLEYGQISNTDIYRSITIPFKMVTTPSVEIMSIDIVPFEDSFDYENSSSSLFVTNCESLKVMVVLVVNNPTKRSFEISCFEKCSGELAHPGTVGTKHSWADESNERNSSEPTIPLTPISTSLGRSSLSLRAFDSFSSSRSPRCSSRSSSQGSIDMDVLGKKLFTASLQAGEAQRISIPMKKMINPLKGSIASLSEGGIASQKNLLSSCLTYIDKNLRLRWKSSNGTVGSLSFRSSKFEMSPSACARMVRSSVEASWEVCSEVQGGLKKSFVQNVNSLNAIENDSLEENVAGREHENIGGGNFASMSDASLSHIDPLVNNSLRHSTMHCLLGTAVKITLVLKHVEHSSLRGSSFAFHVYKRRGNGQFRLLDQGDWNSFFFVSGSTITNEFVFDRYGAELCRTAQFTFLQTGEYLLGSSFKGDFGGWKSTFRQPISVILPKEKLKHSTVE